MENATNFENNKIEADPLQAQHDSSSIGFDYRW